jgi:general secretion pathway protein E
MAKKEDFNITYLTNLIKKHNIIIDDIILNNILFSSRKIESRILTTKFPTSLERRLAKYTVSPVEVLIWYNKVTLSSKYDLKEDDLMKLIAKEENLEYIKINSLKVDTSLAIKYISRNFARINVLSPLFEEGNELHIATDNPFNTTLFEQLKIQSKKEVIIHLSSKTDILNIVNEIFGFNVSVEKAEKDFGDPTSQKLGNLEQLFKLKTISEIDANDKHMINAVDYLLNHAITMKASDIHIEPKREFTVIRFRIDGVLHVIQKIPASLHPAFSSRLKNMSRLDIAERRKPQDGRIKIDKNGKEVELRISTVPVAFGEKIVLRIFDPEMLFKDLKDLGFNDTEYAKYEKFINSPNGLILITGPTGSGKTTTLYSSLRTRVDDSINIVTIEDPVEMVYEAFNQISVNATPKVNLTFSNALKTILRQDPDIIMVGEIRDRETATNAVQAALTGHLVFASLHTNDSVSAIDRLLDLGVDKFLIATTLIGVIAQRLVRKICVECKSKTYITREEAKIIGLKLPVEKKSVKTYVGLGCPACRGTGFSGRVAIYELFEVNSKIKRLIIDEEMAEIERAALMDGMKTLKDNSIKKLAEGVTSYSEVLRVIF